MVKPLVARVRWARLLAVALALLCVRLAGRLAEQTDALDAAATRASRREAVVEALRRRTQALDEELRAARLLASTPYRDTEVSVTTGWPGPAIDGSVLAVRANVVPAVVLLSVGRRARVERGLHFTVYRGDRFVAKAVVEWVEDEAALARVLFTAEGEEVRDGDLVATRLQ